MYLSRPEAACLRNLLTVAQLAELGQHLTRDQVASTAVAHGLSGASLPKLLQLLGFEELEPESGEERSNRTIGVKEASDASAITRVYDVTRRLMERVPKAGWGVMKLHDPSGWTVEITRGEVGCGDAHRFQVCAIHQGVERVTSELLIVARRGEVHADLPGITPGKLGDWAAGRVHEMVAKAVGVWS